MAAGTATDRLLKRKPGSGELAPASPAGTATDDGATATEAEVPSSATAAQGRRATAEADRPKTLLVPPSALQGEAMEPMSGTAASQGLGAGTGGLNE
mmetsp:Transcript_35351/g.114453  ORF Transcript_35351/g.114453 Transcript_35351/m.114453 type:complete len:97 (-) Transcript_35351:1754-2044(-)